MNLTVKDIFGKCGCNCVKCPAYKENARTPNDRKYCSDGWARYLGARLKPEICYCEGCQTPEPWKSGNLLPARGCILRACAIKMGIKNCAYCPFCPCEELKVVIPDENFRKRITKRIGTAIPEADYQVFIKPYEGIKNLANVRKSLKKEDIVKKPVIKPLNAKIIEFPTNLLLSKQQIKSYKSIHSLLTKILEAKANTYARQMKIRNRRPLMLNLLWVFGLYGKLKDRNLIIDGKTYGSLPDFNNLVRKYDNTLHSYLKQSLKILRKSGVKVEYTQVNKYWLFKLTMDKRAGGIAALKALNIYVTKLVKKYGKPVYTGASRFKGKAFTLFSEADMQILKGRK